MTGRARALALLLALFVGLTVTACGSVTIAGHATPAAPAPLPASSGTTITPAPRPTATPPPRPGGPSSVTPKLTPSSSGPSDKLEVAGFGFSTWAQQYRGQLVSFAVMLRNPNAAPKRASSAKVRVTFTDAAGQVVHTKDELFFGDVGPGMTTAMASSGSNDVKGVATAMQVEVLDSRWIAAGNYTPGEVTNGPPTIRPAGDMPDTLLIDCPAASTFLSKVNVSGMTMVYLDAGGAIIGGSSTNVDVESQTLSLPGNGNATFTMRAWTPPPTGVPAAACYANFQRRA